MKKEKFNEIIEDLKLSKNEWITLSEVESILLNNGRGIYPNWKHMRFQFTDDSILIQHGDSLPYGARLGVMFNFSVDYKQVTFPTSSVIAPSQFYSNFRYPKAGDILRVTNGCENIISENFIESVTLSANSVIIKCITPIKISRDFRLSFYDPLEYDKKFCMHSEEVEGIYMKFKSNDGKDRKLGIFHEIIKCRDIAEFTLKLSKKNKTYTIRG